MKYMFSHFMTGLTMLFVLYSPSTVAGIIIETFSDWDGASSATFGGSSDFAPRRAGQTFIAPTGNAILNEFSFWIDDNIDPNSIPLKGVVYQFDSATNHAVGNAIFESATQITTNNGGIGGFEKITFSTGGLTLSENTLYIAYAESQLDISNPSSFDVGLVSGNPFSEGDWRASLSQLTPTAAAWSFIPTSDQAFEFSYSSSITVQSPMVIWLLIPGLFGLIIMRRKQFRSGKSTNHIMA